MTSVHRNHGIDIFKVASAMAVIWIHAADSEVGKEITIYCRFAVPFFSAVLAYFSTSAGLAGNERGGIAGYLLARFNRIYVPFIIWSLVYLGLRLAKHEYSSGGSPIVLGWSTLLCGTTHHLWFLPFAFFTSVLFFGFGRLMSCAGRDRSWAVCVLAVCLFVCVGLVSGRISIDLTARPASYFLFYACDALPAALLGCGVRFLPVPDTARGIRSGSVVLFVISVIALGHFGYHSILSGAAGGALLLFSLWSTRIEAPSCVSKLAGSSFGIYAVHLAFVEALQFLLLRARVVPSLSSDVIVFALSLALSLALCLILARFGVTRPLVQ